MDSPLTTILDGLLATAPAATPGIDYHFPDPRVTLGADLEGEDG